MTVHSGDDVNPERDAFIRELLDRAAQIRMPELFAGHPEALWHLPNRNGVSVIVLRTPSLRHDQLIKILTYRLTQYVLADQLDTDVIYRRRLQHEPASAIGENDIHLLAGTPDSGEVLCYSTIESLRGAPAGATLRMRDRPLFPVEQVFGWGIFNRLRIPPDLPIGQVRE